MLKRLFLTLGFIGLMGLSAPLRAAQMGGAGPSIFINPTDINTGELVPPKPVSYTITINNPGKSLLYISKLKYL